MVLKNQVVLITGCSSGIGLECALQCAAKGAKVYATMRNMKKQGDLLQRAKQEKVQLTVLPLDVTKLSTIKKAVQTIVQKEKRIDVLVNNAGYGLFGAFEELSRADIQKQFDMNVFGLLDVTKACLPHMEEGSRILNVASVIGQMGIPMMGAYCASKFAVEGISEALRREVYKKGIYVTVVEPGGTATKFGGPSLQVGGKKNSPYHKRGMQMRKNMSGRSSFQDSAAFVAQDMVRIAEKRRPGVRYGVGMQGRIMRIGRAVVPDSIIDWLALKVL